LSTATTQAFSALAASLLWLTLLHAAWVALAVAAAVAWLFQLRTVASHRVRHEVLMASLLLVVIVPVVLGLIQSAASCSRIEMNSRADEPSLPDPATKTNDLAADRTHSRGVGEADAGSASTARQTIEAFLARGAAWLEASQACGLATWGLFSLGGLVALALGVHATSRILHGSDPADERLIARTRELAGALSMSWTPDVRIHGTIDQPALYGLFVPAILLPAEWLRGAASELLDAVLLHELAHARRRDPLWNGLQCLLEVTLLFHPAVCWLSRSLRREREFAADALAVQATANPLALARAIESVARIGSRRQSWRLVGAMFRGRENSLLPRIQELLGMKPERPRIPMWSFAAVSSAVVLALVMAFVGVASNPGEAIAQAPPPDQEPLVVSVAIDEEHDCQISYEVRFVETQPDVWRDGRRDKLTHVPGEPGTGPWIVGHDTLKVILKSIVSLPGSTITFAPKATVFAGQHLLFRGQPTAAGQRWPETTVRLCGKPEGSKIRMEVEVSDVLTATWRRGAGAPKKQSRVVIKDAFDLADGSSVVLGVSQLQQPVQASKVKNERLIIITPRKIVLESEEVPSRARQTASPANP
jgi:beta-lactamase regulating signal transducer with metallopeptidase domain